MQVAGDKIYAQPGTITGSIGVVTGKMNASALAQEIGVNPESIEQGSPNLTLQSPFTRPDEKQEAKINEIMDSIYDDFLGKVAKGRGMTVEAVRKLAGGRVYTGKQTTCSHAVLSRSVRTLPRQLLMTCSSCITAFPCKHDMRLVCPCQFLLSVLSRATVLGAYCTVVHGLGSEYQLHMSDMLSNAVGTWARNLRLGLCCSILSTGDQAKDIGLVDDLGGLSQAVAAARKLADLPEAPGQVCTVYFRTSITTACWHTTCSLYVG